MLYRTRWCKRALHFKSGDNATKRSAAVVTAVYDIHTRYFISCLRIVSQLFSEVFLVGAHFPPSGSSLVYSLHIVIHDASARAANRPL